MKVLTPLQMREIDHATIASGIPGLILMENAAARVVEYLASHFSPLAVQRIVIVCGKGNNGGDGLAIARQLHVRFHPRFLRVVLICDPAELTGDAAENLQMLRASGLRESRGFESSGFDTEMPGATLVVDAVLGTGLRGAASGDALDAIVHINTAFPDAKVIAVDIPSGLSGESGVPPGVYVRASATVTFTAPKVCHAMPPACDLMGDLVIAPIGSPASLYEEDPRIDLALVTPSYIAPLFAPRARDANKGSFGHALVVAGSSGKAGAAAMAGIAALRAGAGLVTVACPESVLPSVAAFHPELMTEPVTRVDELARKRTLVAIGPGIGTSDEAARMVWALFDELDKPLILDADALNCLALRSGWRSIAGLRVLTPHPGEMSRLTGRTVTEIQADRIGAARAFARERNVTVVLKGERTVIGFPDGRVWINPTGSPAMATGGTGDVLTGMVAGLMAQFPADPDRAIAGAVYLHGLAGQIAARRLTEQCVVATDLLDSLLQVFVKSCVYTTSSEEETIELGRALASELTGAVFLIGNLGAGKTTLAKGIVAGRKVATANDVLSPTFTLIHQYGEGDFRIYHVDLYRLDSLREVESLGLYDLFAGDALVLLEWAERFPELMLPPHTEIHLRAQGDDTREITVTSPD